MRFAEKGDLLEFTLKNGPISETQARIWLRQLALGTNNKFNQKKIISFLFIYLFIFLNSFAVPPRIGNSSS